MNIQSTVLHRLVIAIFLMLATISGATHAEEKTTCNIEQTKKDMNVMMERDYRERLIFISDLKAAEEKKGRKLLYQEALPLTENMQKSDKLNQQELDRIVAACGWPSRSVLGAEPVRIAGRIMIHAPPEFTLKHFDQMWASYKAGETSPLRMATVIDDQLIFEGKPQRYGTRENMNSDGTPDSVEDPEHLEERRREFGIPLNHMSTDLD